MSSWSEVDLSTVPSDIEILPEGKYVFELLPGARFSKWDANRVEAAAKVVAGEFEGKIQYYSYPDPAKVGDWVIGVLVRMAKAASCEIEENESPVDFLNRVAGTKFKATVYHRTYDKEGEGQTKAELKIGSIMPV